MGTISLAVSVPKGLVQSTADWCQGLGPGAFDTAPNFTLAAYDTSGSNANTTGVPLVLTETSLDSDTAYMAIATYATQPDNTFAAFSLSQGVLSPNVNATGVNVTDLSVNSGDAPSFVASETSVPAPAQVYCGVADTDPHGGNPYPILSVNKDTDSFSLCKSTSGDSNGQDIVVFEAAQGSSDYDFSTCTPVHVQLIGLD
ncbi:uncharacterized protein C8Q71DRAFT_702151 [Rhodofomes roseus]|nr:uncharacterized protein C8Q71DRAFT_702151 [Rhodofomes roseus]KAH9840745.1 hypothetical protein C8Q71DRAFT_702151 [Rhodofomes roseus]